MSAPDRPPAGPLARLADLAVRRRGLMVIVWVAILAATVALLPRVAGDFAADYSTPGADSSAAADLIEERLPGSSAESVDVVWQAPQGALAPEARERVHAFLAEASTLEGIGDAGRPRASADGTIATVDLSLDRPAWDVPVATGERLIDLADEAQGGGVRIELGGGPIVEAEGGGEPELVGLVAAAVVLLVAFGSLVAVGMPIAVALVGLGISTGLIGIATLLVDVPEWAPAVSALIGIGVGIDYALLILTRFRSALADGLDVRDAVVQAVTTAGRSVLIAGGTVVISLLGLFLMGVSYMMGVAVAAIIAVLVVMAASVTLLPALLALAGRRVDRLRIPGLGRAMRVDRPSPAVRWARAVQRRPWTAAIAATAVLLALATPALGLRLGFPDAGNNPTDSTTRAAYDLIGEGFGPGANGPLLVTADLSRPGSAADLQALSQDLRATEGVAFVAPPRINEAGDAAIVAVIPDSAPQDAATQDLVDRLRAELPDETQGGARLLVGGTTAAFVDQSELVSERLPLFVAGVVGLSFLLLLVAFRAPVMALKAGLMNLLSVGAAYGVVALVAEGGWAGGLLGIEEETPVAPFIPVMMFAILFGLSMDYEVFLLSRVREQFLSHGDSGRAVVEGLARTARVITAAAAIMVVVFLAFLASPEVFLKLMGIGLATAIFVDATIVRMVLVPAVMQILGRANWWLPRWLDRRLPRLDVEPSEPAPSAR
jgi:putative drug exporter of the RND superfamily